MAGGDVVGKFEGDSPWVEEKGGTVSATWSLMGGSISK